MPSTLQARATIRTLWPLVTREQQVRSVSILTVAIGTDQQEAVGLFLTTGIPFTPPASWVCLGPPMPCYNCCSNVIIEVITVDADHSRFKVRVTSPSEP